MSAPGKCYMFRRDPILVEGWCHIDEDLRFPGEWAATLSGNRRLRTFTLATWNTPWADFQPEFSGKIAPCGGPGEEPIKRPWKVTDEEGAFGYEVHPNPHVACLGTPVEFESYVLDSQGAALIISDWEYIDPQGNIKNDFSSGTSLTFTPSEIGTYYVKGTTVGVPGTNLTATADLDVIMVEIKEQYGEEPPAFVCVGSTQTYTAEVTPQVSGTFAWSVNNPYYLDIVGPTNMPSVTVTGKVASASINAEQLYVEFTPSTDTNVVCSATHPLTAVELKFLTGSESNDMLCVGSTKTYTAEVAPSLPGSFLWSVNNPDRLDIVGPNNMASVTVTGKVASASVDAEELTVAYLIHNEVICPVSTNITIIKVELGMNGVADGEKITTGGFVPVNANNDNASGMTNGIPATRDFDASDYTDSDLVPITLSLEPITGLSGTLQLRKIEEGRDRIKVWETISKSAEVPLPKTWAVGTDTVPTVLYIEGLREGEALRDIDLILEYVDGESILCADTIKITVTPVLESLSAIIAEGQPDLAKDGSKWIHTNKGRGQGQQPVTVEFEASVMDVPNPAGQLVIIQHASLSNLLPGNIAVSGHSGTDKKLDYESPHTGNELVDASADIFPFYGDLDSSPIRVEANDTPSMWVGPTGLWPLDSGHISNIDLRMNFTLSAAWQYPDGTIYFLGTTAWSVRIQGQLQDLGDEVEFVGGPSNINTGSSVFVRNNENRRTAPPSADESVKYMDP